MPNTNEKKILLISADKDFTEVLKKYVKLIGYHLIHFDSGSSGLQYAKKRNCFVILVSQDVPDIAGDKVISILNKQDINCPLFLLTEKKISQMDYNSFMKFGADTIFSAPINFGLLLLEIDNAVKNFEPSSKDNFVDLDAPEISMPARFHFTVRDISETGCRFHSHFAIERNSIVILSAPEISDKLALPLDTIYPVRIMNCVAVQNGKGYDLGCLFVALQENVYTRLHHACRSVKGFKFTAFS